MPRPQRILLITSDHMRSDFIAAQGQNWLHTPNLDRLVRGGVSFANCFAQNPVCMPSRASFLTSLYPAQTGVDSNGPELHPQRATTAPQAFAAAGFTTGHIGKLHLQDHYDHDLEARHECRYGFEWFERSESRGCYLDAWTRWLDCEHPEHRGAWRTSRPSDPRRSELSGTVVAAPWTTSQAGWIAERAATWYRAPFFSRLDRSSFLHLGFHHPHPPLNPSAEAFAAYAERDVPDARWGERDVIGDKPDWLAHFHRNARDPEQLREYRRYFGAMVTEMDMAIGQVLDALAAEGALEDTLVVFTSDHGDMCGDHGLTHKGPHFYDEVMRVPLVLHWPAGLGSTSRCEEALIEMVDLLPTLLGCAGAPIPEAMQGCDWSEALLAGRPVAGREDVYATNRGSCMVRTAGAKYIMHAPSGTEVLYDYADGQGHEVHNRAHDPQARELLARMRVAALRRQLMASASPGRPDRPF
ncbi:MAG: sulfatase [Planctomycetota bacterium]